MKGGQVAAAVELRPVHDVVLALTCVAVRLAGEEIQQPRPTRSSVGADDRSAAQEDTKLVPAVTDGLTLRRIEAPPLRAVIWSTR